MRILADEAVVNQVNLPASLLRNMHEMPKLLKFNSTAVPTSQGSAGGAEQRHTLSRAGDGSSAPRGRLSQTIPTFPQRRVRPGTTASPAKLLRAKTQLPMAASLHPMGDVNISATWICATKQRANLTLISHAVITTQSHVTNLSKYF